MADVELDAKLGSNTDGRVIIPENIPNPEKKPSYKIDWPNYADNEETAKKAICWIKGFLDTFKAQDAWERFMESMDIADEMCRAAINRVQLTSSESANTEDTRSKVKSADFHSDLVVINAGETAVMLDKENQLPVIYEPMPDSLEYSAELGALLAEERNAVLAYSLEKANMREAIKRHLWRTNKYGNSAIEMQWDYRKAERTVKEPSKYEEIELANGDVVQKPVKFKKKTKIVVIADHPVLVVHDMADVRFDAMIENMQDQSCIDIRTQKQLSDLWAQHLAGQFKNMDKVSTDQLYSDEGEDHVKSDRQDNAGEGNDIDIPNTLFDLHYGWVRIPVDDETGKWDEKSQIAHWYEYVMVGSIDKAPVLVKLSPLPYSCGLVPFSVTHALEDDKGALHMGYADLVKSIIAQEMTHTDQAIDNVTARNQKPWIVEKGSINIRDMAFTAAGNKVWWKKPGAENPTELEVKDTTGLTLNMLNFLDDKRRKTMGVNKPLQGEALGGRTSAGEAMSVFEQALKPSLEATKYKANQIFPFIATWISEMWKDFGNPDLVINLTGKSPVKQVKPADIFGDMRIKVTAVKQFQDGILRRKEADAFITQFIPLLLQNRVMSPADLARFAKDEMANREFTGVDNYISIPTNSDAQHVAKAENQNIVFYGVFDQPMPEEDHKTHLKEHTRFAGSVALAMDRNDPRYANINNLKVHIQTHEQFLEGTANQQAMQQPEITNQLDMGSAPRTEGEAFGDMAGALQNPAGMPTI